LLGKFREGDSTNTVGAKSKHRLHTHPRDEHRANQHVINASCTEAPCAPS